MSEVQYNYVQPTHYERDGKEVIDMMIDIWGVEKVAIFCDINSFKYRMRAGTKPNNPIEQEIQKALWYEAKAKELKSC